ncbi:MAG: TetR/AcrR family transcriptional regulator [Anaerolineae bacterium]|nr:TetR/AcrR family transcriptional regulator [Anaerolineae bacterium]MDQ7037140.1 TetR/AcrR family transcriptional regulator [Anaerolineae bacterium]
MPQIDNSTDDIEARVLDAASELFIRYGYDKSTMNDIASNAGVAKSTIYLRWKKKEDVFRALLIRESCLVTEEWIDRVEADPKGGTYGAWIRHATVATFSNPFLTALYKQDRRVLGSMIERLGQTDLYQQRQAMFLHFFEALQDANAVRKDLDAHVLTYLLNSLQFGLIHFADVIPPQQTPDLSRVWEVLVEMVERLVTPEDGGDAEAGKVVVRQFMQQVRQRLDEFEKQSSFTG